MAPRAREGAPRTVFVSVLSCVTRTTTPVFVVTVKVTFCLVVKSALSDATYTLALRGDELVLRRKNVDGDTPLVVQFADVFSAVGTGSIRFTRNGKHRVSGFLLSTGRVRKLRFDKT